jgi:ligand-binding sensor domain-containing protein
VCLIFKQEIGWVYILNMSKHLQNSLTFIVLFLTLASSPGLSQTVAITPSAKFDHLTIEQGLSQSLVFNIYQDIEGFLWFATQDGLNRYDGYTFRIYRNRINDSTSISHNDIRGIVGDASGNLWLSTAGGGLNQFETRSGIFKHYYSEINNPQSLSTDLLNSLCLDDSGMLWIGTQGGGLNLFNTKLKTIKRYLISAESHENILSNIINCIFEDSKQQLWIGSEQGLYKFSREKGQFDYVNLLSNNDGFKVSSIVEDEAGIFWIGVEGRGLIRFNPESYEIKYYYLNYV